MSRLASALLDLTINSTCIIQFEINPASSPLNPHIAIRVSNHGINLRGNISINDWNDDRICQALKQLIERLELEAKATKLKG